MLEYDKLDIMKQRSPLNGYYALRWKILERDKFTCQCCGQYAPNVKLEVDHIIPVAEGGTDDELNLRTSCYACNRGRNGLAIITRIQNERKIPKPYASPSSIYGFRQEETLSIIQQYPNGISVPELAKILNINRNYIHVLLHRLCHSSKVERITKGVYKICQPESIT